MKVRFDTVAIVVTIVISLLLFYKLWNDSKTVNEVKLNENYNPDFSDYILLKSYDVNKTDKGGFYWWVHMVASLVELGKITNKKVLVLFDDGYYLDKNRSEKSWWNYFFKYPNLTDEEYSMIKEAEKRGFTEVVNIKLKPTRNMYLFTNKTFQDVMRKIMTTDKTTLVYKDFLRVQPDIDTIVQSFVKDNNIRINNDILIGVHYRGTDKFFGNGDKEDLLKNKHMSYDHVCDNVQTIYDGIKRDQPDKKVLVYVASDELPFVQHFKTMFGDDIAISYEAFRVDTCTSGIELKDDVRAKTHGNSKHSKMLKHYADQSIHRGNNNVSGYKKGVDAIVDVALLSLCNIYVKTQRGNFASQPKKWNPNINEIELSQD